MVWLTLVWLNRFDVGFFFSFSFSGYNFSFRNIRNGNFIWNLKNRCWFQIWSNLELVLKKDEIFVSSEFRKFEIVNLLATYIDCIAKVGTKTFFFNSSTSILKFSILWIRRGRSVNPITCFSNPSSSGTKRYSRFVVREVNRQLGLGKVPRQNELRGVNFKQLDASSERSSRNKTWKWCLKVKIVVVGVPHLRNFHISFKI